MALAEIMGKVAKQEKLTEDEFLELMQWFGAAEATPTQVNNALKNPEAANILQGDHVAGQAGGWTLAENTLTSKTGTVGMNTQNDPAIFAGSTNPGAAPFRVNHNGAIVATSANITGTVTATAGAIGGWTIVSNAIQKFVSGAIGIILDAANQIIRVGNTGGTHIQIDGANKRIRSSNYVSGASGFNIDGDTGDAEYNNITARGMIKTAVFQKDVVSAVGGTLLVLDSDVLATDMTALNNSTLTISGKTTFAVGDILRMKDETYDEWLRVLGIASAPTYQVERDLGAVSAFTGDAWTDSSGNTWTDSSGNTWTTTDTGSYALDSNPVWKRGQAVVRYGAGGSGGVQIASGTTPEVSVFSHNGTPWSNLIKHVRLLKTLFAVGSDLSAASTTSFQVFPAAQTYNGESMGAGDVLLGDNSSGRPNLFWDSSAASLIFRLGTTAMNSISTGSLLSAGCRVSTTANTTVLATNSAYLTFGVVGYDDASFVNLGTQPTRVTIPTGYGGRYHVDVYVYETGSTASSLQEVDVAVEVSGGPTDLCVDSRYRSLTGTWSHAFSGEGPLSAGDYLRVRVTNYTSENLLCQGYISVTKVR